MFFLYETEMKNWFLYDQTQFGTELNDREKSFSLYNTRFLSIKSFARVRGWDRNVISGDFVYYKRKLWKNNAYY